MRCVVPTDLKRAIWIALFSLLPALAWAKGRADYVSSVLPPPPPQREFRGTWVATVNNIDWPSQPGLPVAQQKAELTAILDRAAQLRLNAVILQVRPASDALYASRLEPWSEYLTGQMGRAPSPFFDPLAFGIEAAHDRGLELHAWFNPFRARHTMGKSPVASDHISKTRPQWVKSYNGQLWLDPGEKGVQDHVLKVILDVVRLYDIDGVHMDDYFYPYPEKDARKQAIDFPDWASWKRYRDSGGKLSRDDWRRDNVDRFVQRLYQAIKAEKRHVKFGISPFGIWRPGYPAQIRGFDSFGGLYADSRKWLREGWVDYFAPQLYWPSDAKEQSFPVLLKWWTEQNFRSRNLWAGCDVTGTRSRAGTEIVRQIRLTRQQAGASGNILWNTRSLMQNRGGVADLLQSQVYAQPALVPGFLWLDSTPPGRPDLSVQRLASGDLKLSWESGGNGRVWLWVLQWTMDGHWTTAILPGPQTSRLLGRGAKPDAVAISAVDRCGNLSTPNVLEKQTAAATR
jgi:uncharacterized lipoprotein YddW (UPF0748 family)